MSKREFARFFASATILYPQGEGTVVAPDLDDDACPGGRALVGHGGVLHDAGEEHHVPSTAALLHRSPVKLSLVLWILCDKLREQSFYLKIVAIVHIAIRADSGEVFTCVPGTIAVAPFSGEKSSRRSVACKMMRTGHKRRFQVSFFQKLLCLLKRPVFSIEAEINHQGVGARLLSKSETRK